MLFLWRDFKLTWWHWHVWSACSLMLEFMCDHWPDLQFFHMCVSIQLTLYVSSNTNLIAVAQNHLWTCHKHENKCLWISWFGSIQLLSCHSKSLLGERNCFWAPPSSDSQADPPRSFKQTSHFCCSQNILWIWHTQNNEPFSSYLVIAEVWGGMHPFWAPPNSYS